MINYGYIQWLYSMVYSMVIPSQWYNQWRRAGLSERPSFRSGAPSSDESMRLGSTGQMSFRDGQDILFSCLKHRENHGKTMGKWWFIWWMGNHQLLLGGDWNHGILNDFPQSMGMSSSQLTNTPSFFTWVETNHQPAIFMGCSWLLMDLRMDFIMIRRDLTSKCTGDIHGNYHIHILWMEEILHQLVTIGQESSDDIPAGNSTWLTD